MTQQPDQNLDAYIDSNKQTYEERLAQLVAVPTVSADPAHDDDIRHGAELAHGILEDAGFRARVVPTSGHPVVYGELIGDPAWPTVLLYNHLDVQPADPDEWQSDPFKLLIEDDKYIGRGATDDKGPAMAVLAAVEYAAKRQVPLNFKVVWEFEEEKGSPNFAAFVQAERAALAADSVVVSDTIWISRQRPAIDYGLRGLVTFEFRLRTAEQDVHSGLAGGVARNPLGELMQIVGKCYDAATGRVTIPGFYDDVMVPADEERASFLRSGFDPDAFIKAHRLQKTRTKDAAEMLDRLMAQPTFEVHGVTGGYTGPGVKTVIPPAAAVKISCRLVAGQDPQRTFGLIRDFVRQINPDIEMVLDAKLAPFLGEFNGPYADAARTAMKSVFGAEPAFIREGGSIGAVVTMRHELNVPIMLLGLSLPEHGYHAPNEHFDWRQASGGIRMFAAYFEAIAKLKQ